MTAVLRIPALVFAFVVERLRRVPGARAVAPLLPWFVRALGVGAVVVVLLWMAEASPQRVSLGQLAAGDLSHMQSWVIVEGDLVEDPGSSPGAHRYILTDPTVPNAHLDVRSETPWPTGRTTVSGRVAGGRDGVPAGYQWSAVLRADRQLAAELPPPWAAAAMLGLALLIVLAGRSRYPAFVRERPGEATPAGGSLRVIAHPERGGSERADPTGILDLGSGTALAELRVIGEKPVDVRLHSAFTAIDVGIRRGLGFAEPGLRVRAADDDLILGFASRRERDAAFASLSAGADRIGGS